MSGETFITVIGNLVDVPELRFTPSGAPVANFRIASTSRVYDRQAGQWKDGDTLFLTCSVWRQIAENVTESLTRGMRVIVHGQLKQRSYETPDGETRTVFELDVHEVGPSLRNATATVAKAATRAGRPPAQDSVPQSDHQSDQRSDQRSGQPAGQEPAEHDPWARPQP